jgi:3-hydroxybutyryl-CoA dehydrogenase
MPALDTGQVIAVVGAGAMGSGIAQVAAKAGHPVLLHDAGAGAAHKGLDRR